MVKKALAAPAPKAAANPSGRQQTIVVSELNIAASEAEMPVPCLTVFSLAGLLALRGESIPRVEDQFAPNQNTGGNSARSSVPSAVLRRRPVH